MEGGTTIYVNEDTFYQSKKTDDTKISLTYYLGHKWIEVTIPLLSGQKKVEVKASLTDNENGRIGIWMPNSDMSEFLTDREAFRYDVSKRASVYTTTKNWDFGKTANIELINKSLEPVEIKFLILAKPWNSSKKSPLNVSVIVSIDGEKTEEKYNYQSAEKELTDDDKITLMREEYELFEKLKTFSPIGKGNIVHPKQYFTLRAIQYLNENDNEFREKTNLKLGYIGTDTTENLRSMLRWMYQTEMIDRIDEIVLYFTTEWDREFMNIIRLKEELNSAYPGITITPLELSDGVIKRAANQENCDLIISTYVAPYLGEESKDQYSNLIANILGEGYLVSVNPQKGSNSVRSYLMRENFNADNIYDNLDLVEFKSPVTGENKSVEWSIWWRGLD